MAATQATLGEFVTESESSTRTESAQRPLEHQTEFETTRRERLAIAARSEHRERFWQYHDRGDYTCPMCGYEAQGVKGEFEVHHIDRDWLNGHIFNLVGLCYPCHRRTHRLVTREQALDGWKQGFLELGDQ